MAEPIRLDLGAGAARRQGYITVDLENNWSEIQPDVVADIRDLPFPDNYADVVEAIHLIEHLPRNETEEILLEWKRVLKPGGKLVIECPCLDKITFHLATGADDPRLTLIGLYGESWRGPDMIHKWCFSIRELKNTLELLDFKNIKSLEPRFHRKERDMRVEATK